MSRTGRFSTAMRDYARRQIENLGNADIVVGIPSYYSDDSLAHVIQMVAEGLDHFYPEKKSLIIVADGGSTDDTREIAQSVDNHHFNIDVLVTIYRVLHSGQFLKRLNTCRLPRLPCLIPTSNP